MKLLLEILISVVLHPLAMIMMWINLMGRSDLSGGRKLIWVAISLLWGAGPVLYILVGDGKLW
jgi:hypothetical protein